MQLTAITLTYNSEQYIERSLLSLQSACENAPIRVFHLIVDAYSTDKTLEIIQRLAPESQVISRERRGIYDAIDFAVAHVHTPYLMYLHSDDEIDPFFISRMSDVLRNLPNAERAVLYGTVDFINRDSQILYSRKPPFYFHWLQKQTNLIFHPNAIYPTAIEQQYPYSTAIGRTADRYHISEIAPYVDWIRVPEARYRFRMSQMSSTIQGIGQGESPSWSVEKIIARIYLQAFETHLLSRGLRRLIEGETYWKNSF